MIKRKNLKVQVTFKNYILYIHMYSYTCICIHTYVHTYIKFTKTVVLKLSQSISNVSALGSFLRGSWASLSDECHQSERVITFTVCIASLMKQHIEYNLSRQSVFIEKTKWGNHSSSLKTPEKKPNLSLYSKNSVAFSHSVSNYFCFVQPLKIKLLTGPYLCVRMYIGKAFSGQVSSVCIFWNTVASK